MNVNNNELQHLVDLASMAVKSMKSEPNYQQSDVLKEYALLYESFLDNFNNNDVEKLKLRFHRLSSLSRAFLETDSDWGKPCLDSMHDFERFGKKIFKY